MMNNEIWNGQTDQPYDIRPSDRNRLFHISYEIADQITSEVFKSSNNELSDFAKQAVNLSMQATEGLTMYDVGAFLGFDDTDPLHRAIMIAASRISGQE